MCSDADQMRSRLDVPSSAISTGQLSAYDDRVFKATISPRFPSCLAADGNSFEAAAVEQEQQEVTAAAGFPWVASNFVTSAEQEQGRHLQQSSGSGSFLTITNTMASAWPGSWHPCKSLSSAPARSCRDIFLLSWQIMFDARLL
jgi:hypothetical protein